ncbi:hypothetical protein KP509_16G072400 [Ceratopteris richardii]|uniref:Magnesium transporter n=1 Tax=Ceratopteris richardii TaxID=49495 RepID=A0A8T2T4F0_CERRI|nr:hypothetical protein KP509_16G072400 [Ceratopteris richardii]
MERALFHSSSSCLRSTLPSSASLRPLNLPLFSDVDRIRVLAEYDRPSSQQSNNARFIHLFHAHCSRENSNTNGLPYSENASVFAAASLLSLVHSLRAMNMVASTLSHKSKLRDQACCCSQENGPSVSEPTTIDFDDNYQNSSRTLAGDRIRGSTDGERCEKLLQEGNVLPVGYPEQRLGGRTIVDDVIDANRPKQNDTLNLSLATSIEGSSIPVKEPLYKVLEVKVDGTVVSKIVSRRLLLKTSGLRMRDIRSVDPSLWVTNSAPALLIRDHAILLNLGSLRAIASADSVLIFDHNSIGATTFLDLLLPRLNPDSTSGFPTMPFELEVVEAALLSRTQRLERRLMEVEPRVLSLLKVLPNCLTANVLEELRLSKQALVELCSKAEALRQMLLELLESPQEIRRMTIMGRRCTIRKEDGSVECFISSDKQLADDEEEEMEMLLENYLQRCESCHGQAERLLDSAKEMEDSIAVNLSSRRLEVSRLELLLQVGTFCSALGALIAGTS